VTDVNRQLTAYLAVQNAFQHERCDRRVHLLTAQNSDATVISISQ